MLQPAPILAKTCHVALPAKAQNHVRGPAFVGMGSLAKGAACSALFPLSLGNTPRPQHLWGHVGRRPVDTPQLAHRGHRGGQPKVTKLQGAFSPKLFFSSCLSFSPFLGAKESWIPEIGEMIREPWLKRITKDGSSAT